MFKSSLLVSAALVTGAFVFNGFQPPVMLSACDVDTRSEAIVWANQNPGAGYIEACRRESGN